MVGLRQLVLTARRLEAARFSKQVHINAPLNRVWEILADIGSIYKWNPGVSHSSSTSENSRDDGATRHCDLQDAKGSNIGYLEERATDWRDRQGFKIDIYESNLPIRRSVVEFSIKADGEGMLVTVTPDYALKYGPIGWLMDLLIARRQYKKGMEELLAGLKYYVETGEQVDTRVPDMASAT